MHVAVFTILTVIADADAPPNAATRGGQSVPVTSPVGRNDDEFGSPLDLRERLSSPTGWAVVEIVGDRRGGHAVEHLCVQFWHRAVVRRVCEGDFVPNQLVRVREEWPVWVARPGSRRVEPLRPKWGFAHASESKDLRTLLPDDCAGKTYIVELRQGTLVDWYPLNALHAPREPATIDLQPMHRRLTVGPFDDTTRSADFIVAARSDSR